MEYRLSSTQGICRKCGEIVTKTHRMQELQTQMVYHLRTHGLTIKDAKIESRKANYS